MNTQKPLRELAPDLLAYISVNYAQAIEYNDKLINIYEGQLLPYVEDSMQRELSPEAFTRAKERIPPVNLCKQLVEKLSRVYVDSASRSVSIDTDGELLDKYEEWFDLDNNMAFANELVSLNKYCALEPYISQGKPGLRVIPSNSFLVWSDNPVNPEDATVFIKFTGTVRKESPAVDSQGRALRDGSMIVRNVQKFTLYSETEILEIDMDGDEVEGSYRLNPYNQIPFVYIKNSRVDLIPQPDTDMFSNTVLIPKLLADTAYAIQFMSHSIIYGIDVDPENLSGNPDAFWAINSREDSGSDSNPQIGTIDPKVDSDKVVDFIQSLVSLWLQSRGLKTSSTGKLNSQNAASGVSKLVDEADATTIRKSQVKIFAKAEKELWQLTKKLHDSWVSSNRITGEGKAFTSNFKPEVTFAEQKPVVDTKSTIEELKGLQDLKLFTPRRAIKKLYPTLDDTQIDEIMAEIEEYNQPKPPQNDNPDVNREDSNDGE